MSTDASVSRFRNLSIHGFRRLKAVWLDLRPLTVMIGANGSGKTSVLDVLSFLANSAQGRLNASISDLSGLPSILTYDGAGELVVRISAEVSGHAPLDYLLRLRPQGVAYEIADEALSQQRRPQPPPFHYIVSTHADIRYFEADAKGLVRPTWDHNPLETSLSQVPKLYREPEDFRRADSLDLNEWLKDYSLDELWSNGRIGARP